MTERADLIYYTRCEICAREEAYASSDIAVRIAHLTAADRYAAEIIMLRAKGVGMSKARARREQLVILSSMIDRAMAFADTCDQILLGAMLAECRDCATHALGPELS